MAEGSCVKEGAASEPTRPFGAAGCSLVLRIEALIKLLARAFGIEASVGACLQDRWLGGHTAGRPGQTLTTLSAEVRMGEGCGLARLTGIWFAGLVGIYLLYAWSVFLGLEGQAVLERLTMALGPSTLAVALLVSPSLFAASAGQTHSSDSTPGRILARRWRSIMLLAGAALLLSLLGATIAASLTSPVPVDPSDAFPTHRPEALELTRQLIPVALSALAVVSGVAGILTGHVTSRWRPTRRNAGRWFFGVTLMASFLLPFLVTTNAIVQHGTSPFRILLNPLAIPLLLTAFLVVLERHALGLGLAPRLWVTNRTAVDPEWLDRVVGQVIGDPDSDIDFRGLSKPEREMVTLATAIHRIARPGSTPSGSRGRGCLKGSKSSETAAVLARTIRAGHILYYMDLPGRRAPRRQSAGRHSHQHRLGVRRRVSGVNRNPAGCPP